MALHIKQLPVRPLDFCLKTPFRQNSIGELRENGEEKKFNVLIEEESGEVVDVLIDGLEIPDVKKFYSLSTCTRHDIFQDIKSGFNLEKLRYIAIKQNIMGELFYYLVYRDPNAFNSY